MKKFEEASIVAGGDGDGDGNGNGGGGENAFEGTKDLAREYLRGKVDIDKDRSLMTAQETNLMTAAFAKIKVWKILRVAGFWNNDTSLNSNKRARQI